VREGGGGRRGGDGGMRRLLEVHFVPPFKI